MQNFLLSGTADSNQVLDSRYVIMVDCADEIVGGLAMDPKQSATAFYSKGFIAKSLFDEIIEVPATKRENAARLFSSILDVIQHYPQRFENFLSVLKENPTLYGELLATLQRHLSSEKVSFQYLVHGYLFQFK